jgi:hypothetical protein
LSRKPSVYAIDWRNKGKQPHARLTDEAVFKLVDEGVELIEFILSSGRYVSSVDEWLEIESKDGVRSMSFTLMSKE